MGAIPPTGVRKEPRAEPPNPPPAPAQPTRYNFPNPNNHEVVGVSLSKMAHHRRTPKVTIKLKLWARDSRGMRIYCGGITSEPITNTIPNIHIQNDNRNSIHHNGNGNHRIFNPIINIVNATGPAPPLQSDMKAAATLPPEPIVFRGRCELVESSVSLLTGKDTTRLAILGLGGMGKTVLALALLHDPRVKEHYDSSSSTSRFFISCEELLTADDIVVSLAKVLKLQASSDLLSEVVDQLASRKPVLLVLDNLETVWLKGGAPVSAVDDLLGRLARIPSVSLIITCRGTLLPRGVNWSNPHTAILEPFSLEAALETFQQISRRKLLGEVKPVAEKLLNAVDRLPLAVSTLAELAWNGEPLYQLLHRWEQEHCALLCTHDRGRLNSVPMSIELSMTRLCAADPSKSSLELLSVCSMLPDGLRPNVFKRLSPHFKSIDRARNYLFGHALASRGADQELKLLSPVRYLVLADYPPKVEHRDALHSIYFDIADHLPDRMGEQFKKIADAASPEIGNLSSLLLNLVDQPSQRVVNAVLRLTYFSTFQRPSVDVASALLPHLKHHPQWKASCLWVVGEAQIQTGDYISAIKCFTAAAQLYLKLGDQHQGSCCKRMTAGVYRLIGEYDIAESLLTEAKRMLRRTGTLHDMALLKAERGELMRMKGNHSAAIEDLRAAQDIFRRTNMRFDAADCLESIGIVHLDRGEFHSAAEALEEALSEYTELGALRCIAQATRFLGNVKRQQGDTRSAESLLAEAQAVYQQCGDRLGLACCAEEFGHLRRTERKRAAVRDFEYAQTLYQCLELHYKSEECGKYINLFPRVYLGGRWL